MEVDERSTDGRMDEDACTRTHGGCRRMYVSCTPCFTLGRTHDMIKARTEPIRFTADPTHAIILGRGRGVGRGGGV